MAQSRMAGMAMDLGPSDLADVGEAATLATNKMGMEQGQQASVLFDLDKGTGVSTNDGKPSFVVKTNGRVYGAHQPAFAYPNRNGKKDNYFNISPSQAADTLDQIYDPHTNFRRY